LEMPTPRVALGLALRGIASSALDVSDGLLGDLGHILAQSRVGACIDTRLTGALLAAGLTENEELIRQCTLAGGDDYELCFTAAPEKRAQVAAAARTSETPVTRIGSVQAQTGLRLLDAQGQELVKRYASFDHFSV
ncbi:MAG: AIR synthase-related protein, partial [Comamonas sp.]